MSRTKHNNFPHQRLDYHWYHTGEPGDSDCVLHIGYLVYEVAEIEQTFVEAVNDAWYFYADRSHLYGDVLDSFPVSVLESGCSAKQGYAPTGLTNEQFQAFEVIRRLGGALASGVRIAGWHSWMAGDTDAFAGHGLRYDLASESEPPSLAVQRPSWFTYQRFVSLMAGVELGSMVLPAVASRAVLGTFLASASAHPFVVFRYTGSFIAPGGPSTAFSRAWLLLCDPGIAYTGSAGIVGRWASASSAGVAVEVPLTYASLGAAVSGTTLPCTTVSYDASTPVLLSRWTAFPLTASDCPVLLFSDEEIDWTVV